MICIGFQAKSPGSIEIDSYTKEDCSIMFGQKQWAITPGQSVVIYESNVCLGGGYIKMALS